jgi:N-acetylmuramoyl-L-alanine amidase
MKASVCDSFKIVSRSEWKANSSVLVKMETKPVSHVFIHHTEGSEWICDNQAKCSEVVRDIQKFHQITRGWDDIGYNFLVGGDGNVYEGRGWDKVGAHTRGMNDKSIAISLIGDYTNISPSDQMLEVTQKLIACGKEKGFVSEEAKIHGHRDQNCTACPGNKLYEIIKSWKNFGGGKLPEFLC